MKNKKVETNTMDKVLKAIGIIALIGIGGFVLLFVVITTTITKGASQQIQQKQNADAALAHNQAWIDKTAQRYYDNHKNLPGQTPTLDESKKIAESCAGLLKNKQQCEDIADRKIWVGMSEDWAVISLGNYQKDNKSVYGSVTHEQLVYGNGFYVYFDDSKLTSYQSSQ